MKEQIQKYARKHIKGRCYLKVTLGHRGLIRHQAGVRSAKMCIASHCRFRSSLTDAENCGRETNESVDEQNI
jgi:hypothetical protein